MRPLLPHLCLSSLLLLGLSGAAPAQSFDFGAPAVETMRDEETGTSIRIATGPWSETGQHERLVEGRVETTAWRLDSAASTLDLARRLESQVTAAGWRVLFTCETRACGGFDFRYGLPLVNEPDMHVDLGDFRYIAAEKDGALISLTVSRSRMQAFVQMVLASPETAAPPVVVAPPTAPAPVTVPQSQGEVTTRLNADGHTVLADLAFASGKGVLEPGDYASLREIVDLLASSPEIRIALVGHTDASGSLQRNIALSKSRAAAVRQALIALGADGNRIEAEGVGYLSPLATNQTPEGRTKNRRVEVLLTSTPDLSRPDPAP